MFVTLRTLAVLLLAGVTFAGCATRAAAPLPVSRAPNIEALLERGCYRCLEEAYEEASASGSRAAAFEAAVLLTLRSKELGLPFAEWLNRARDLIPGDAGWSDYLAIAEAVPADPLSDDRDAVLVTRRPPRATLDAWRQLLTAGPGSPFFRAYLDLTLVCGPTFIEEREAAVAAVLAKFGHVALLRYRSGICGRTPLLTELIQQNPDFVDVNLERARAALQRERPDYDEALARLASAHADFPASATIIATIGNIHSQREEWPEALEAYETTLTRVPTHRDALIGATISLSHLGRHEEAIETAGQLLELGNWFIADAHYWRAWNEYRLGRIGPARTDVDRARALARDPATLVLSGIIAWRETRLDVANAEFEEALNLDFGQCEAASYLGGVRAEQRRWQESLAAFQHAAQCFELSVVTRRKAVAELTSVGGTSSTVARQVASHERAIAEADLRRIEAVNNIASIQRRIATPYTGDAAEPVLTSP